MGANLLSAFDALREKCLYEYWNGEWNIDFADERSRRPFLNEEGTQRKYRRVTTADLAQAGWAFLGSGYQSAEQGRRVMEHDDVFAQVFPQEDGNSIHCTQLLLAFRIGDLARTVLRKKAVDEGHKPSHYSALRFPILTALSKSLCDLYEREENHYLDVNMSRNMLATIDDWCLFLAQQIASGLMLYLNTKIRQDPTRGYRSLVRQGEWVNDAWDTIREFVNNGLQIAPAGTLSGMPPGRRPSLS